MLLWRVREIRHSAFWWYLPDCRTWILNFSQKKLKGKYPKCLIGFLHYPRFSFKIFSRSRKFLSSIGDLSTFIDLFSNKYYFMHDKHSKDNRTWILVSFLLCFKILGGAVVTKRQLSKNAKLSVFKWVVVPISPVVINLRWRLKEYCQKNKRQRWDVCEGFSVWHFATKSTGLKPVKPRM